MEFELKEAVKELACGHCYHPDCLDSWLNVNPVCPLCKVCLPAFSLPRTRKQFKLTLFSL